MKEVETLGRRIRELRDAEPYMKLRELAAALGATPEWLSDVEADRVRPNLSELGDLSMALGVPLEDLRPLWQAWEEAPPPDYSAGICSGRRPR